MSDVEKELVPLVTAVTREESALRRAARPVRPHRQVPRTPRPAASGGWDVVPTSVAPSGRMRRSSPTLRRFCVFWAGHVSDRPAAGRWHGCVTRAEPSCRPWRSLAPCTSSEAVAIAPRSAQATAGARPGQVEGSRGPSAAFRGLEQARVASLDLLQVGHRRLDEPDGVHHVDVRPSSGPGVDLSRCCRGSDGWLQLVRPTAGSDRTVRTSAARRRGRAPSHGRPAWARSPGRGDPTRS